MQDSAVVGKQSDVIGSVVIVGGVVVGWMQDSAVVGKQSDVIVFVVVVLG